MIRLIINSVIKNTSFPISHNKYVYLGIGIAKYDLLYKKSRKPLIFQGFRLLKLACVRGFEPPTFWSVAKRSIQLS